MCPASVSGIETRDAPVTGSYWPILSLVPSNSPRGLCKVTRPCFLPSKVLNESSALSFFKFFYSYFGRSFLPFSGLFFIFSHSWGSPLLCPFYNLPGWLVVDPTQRGSRWSGIMSMEPYSPYTWASCNIFFVLSCFLYQLCFKLRI